MLYFSSVQIDPDKINSAQLEKLRQFKVNTYPKGLVETYKKPNDFRDKFARQLERKIGELKTSDESGEIPLSLEFLNVENAEPIGSSLNHVFDHPNVSDFDVLLPEERDAVKPYVEAAIKEKSYFPIALVIKNSSPSGIRNLYVELNFSAMSDKLEVTDSPEERLFGRSSGASWSTILFSPSGWQTRPSKILQRKLAKFDADRLQRTDQG